MDVSPSVIGAVSAAIVVPIFMGLVGKVKTLQPVKKTEKDFDQLAKEYSKWEMFALVPLFIFTPAIGFLIWYFLDLASRSILSSLGENIFLFPPTTAVWALPAIFMSIFLAAIPMHYLYLGLLGKQRYSEYTEYGNLKHSMDSWKVLRYMAYVCIPICIAFSGLALDSYIRVTEDTFVSNDLLSLGERAHNFDEIESIELTKSFKAPNGNIVRRSYYAIEFKDGYIYDFDNSLSELGFEEQREIISYITKGSTALIKVNDPYPK
jgi:hypothetical protein